MQVKKKDDSAAGEEEQRTVSIIASLLLNIAKQVRRIGCWGTVQVECRPVGQGQAGRPLALQPILSSLPACRSSLHYSRGAIVWPPSLWRTSLRSATA